MSFLDKYFFSPSIFHKLLIFLLLPFSFLYSFVVLCTTKTKKKYFFKIPIISVGNISVGGNGKTPFCKEIVNLLYPIYGENIFIILRGYKRKSKGLYVIKHNNKILEDVNIAGDEAMEHAIFSKAQVIVAEDRVQGILKAIELGAKCVVLDDAFSKFYINKFDILLNSKYKYKYNFTLPSGAYRLPLHYIKYANMNLFEDKDYKRFSYIKNPKENMILISAIAKPFRLLQFKDRVKNYYFYNDHSDFKYEEIQKLMSINKADSILLSKKDYVKMKDFGFDLVLIEEELQIEKHIKDEILAYVKGFDVYNKNDK